MSPNISKEILRMRCFLPVDKVMRITIIGRCSHNPIKSWPLPFLVGRQMLNFLGSASSFYLRSNDFLLNSGS